MFGVRVLLRRNSFILSRNVEIKDVRDSSSLSSVNSLDNKFNSTPYQPIAEFYAGKSVFVTGGTGFLGKVFLEKLLYSCNKLDKVYIFVRAKKGENINTRIQDIFDSPLFERLKKSNPDFIEKVEPITGDLTLPNLGLSSKDEQILTDKVSVVYHGAATVKFNEPLPVAMNINFEGTRKVLELSQRMKNIEAFVYISTAYSQTTRKVLLETVYPAPAKVEDIYKFIEKCGYDTEETSKLIGERPNTYTYSKALAEAHIAEHHGTVPAVILRPSSVTAAHDEPIKGWVENRFGGTPMIFDAGRGWHRFIHASSSHVMDFIPVDYVSNMSIIAAARAKRSREVQVFNCTTSADNPVTWYDAHKYFNKEMVLRGKNEVPYPKVMFVKSKTVLDILTFLFQTTPAHIADLWLKMTGRKPKYEQLISEIVKTRKVYDFFTNNNWVMRTERARELYMSLSPEDRKTFPCDPTQIVWSDLYRNYCECIFRYLKPKFKFIAKS